MNTTQDNTNTQVMTKEEREDAALVEYKSITGAAWADFRAAKNPEASEYMVKFDPAFPKYEAIKRAAWAKYESTCDAIKAE